MKRHEVHAVLLSLAFWHLVSSFSYRCASSCLPNVTPARGHNTDEIQLQQQHESLPMHQDGVFFRIQGFPCGRDGTCCSKIVHVTQGAPSYMHVYQKEVLGSLDPFTADKNS